MKRFLDFKPGLTESAGLNIVGFYAYPLNMVERTLYFPLEGG